MEIKITSDYRASHEKCPPISYSEILCLQSASPTFGCFGYNKEIVEDLEKKINIVTYMETT